MPLQVHTVHVLIFVAVLISIEAGFFLILRYKSQLARWAGMILLCQALELASYLLQSLGILPSLVLAADLLQILAYSLFCFLWLLFVFHFSRSQGRVWLGLKNLLLVLPPVYLVMMAAKILQGSVASPKGGGLVGSILLSPLAEGLPGILMLIYLYGTVFLSCGVLAAVYSRSDARLRRTLLPLFFAPMLLAVAGALELAGVNPVSPASIQQLTLASVSLFAFLVVFDLRFRGALTSAREIVIDQMPDGMIVLDRGDRITDLNPAAQKILGTDRKRAMKRELSAIWPQGANLIAEGAEAASPIGYSKALGEGVQVDFDLNVSPLVDSYGQSLGRVAILRDITDRKRHERKVEDLLAEKELILREVHHRVKNNMAMVDSLLSLQAGSLESPPAIAALEDAGKRLRGMMLLYDRLYLSGGFSEASVESSLSALVDEIIANFPNSSAVRVEKRFDDFALDAKRLQSVGIILNELLTNIMKYAFAGRTLGLIGVSMTLREGLVTLEVSDDGRGVPEGFGFDTSPGFGLFLIRELSRQMKASPRIERGEGTRVFIEFKYYG